MAQELAEHTMDTAHARGTALSLPELMARAGRKQTDKPRILAIDPGDTTGWVVLQGGELARTDHMPGTPLNLHNLIVAAKPDVVVVEEYRIYGWKAEQHAWSDVPTLRLIGAIELSCALNDVPIVMQSPKEVKPFCTDAKLKGWGLFQPTHELRHRNDAIRHAAFFALFGKMPTKTAQHAAEQTVNASRLRPHGH